KVFANLGVDLHKARRAVESFIGRGDHIVLGEIGLTPSAKMVIKLSGDCARHLNHHAIGTEHLLLGLIHEKNCIAAGVLESLGINLAQVHKLTFQMSNQTGQSEP
ncbi:MAG: NDP-hexose 4-ketoreductase, partial [Chloroflexi bacterium]